MAFADCIISARDQGAISREEADDLVNRYERFKRARAGDDRAARADLAADLTEQAERKRRLAELQEAAVTRIEADISGYRTPGGQADILGAVASVLANENPEIAHLELNPVSTHPGGLDVLGARITLAPASLRQDSGRRAMT